MEGNPTSLDPRTLARIKGLHLRARHIVEGYVAGLHRSPFRGFSIEFAEHRDYAPGDDLRYVDWKVYGRTDKLYVKQYDDETNLVCQLVLDVSQSMSYRSPSAPLSKFEYGQALAAALAWLVLQQQDAVGLVTFDQQVRAAVRPSSHAVHLQPIFQVLETAVLDGRTRAGAVFHALAERLTRRSVVVVLSDLFDAPSALLAGLQHFRHRQHDVIVFHILDPQELDFSFQRPTRFQGLEQRPHVLADPRSMRRAYLREFAEFQRAVRIGCRRLGLDYVEMRTDRPFDVALSHYLSRRAARVRGA